MAEAKRSKVKAPPSQRGRGRPRTPGGPRPRTPIAVTIRGVEPWREWMASACSALGERSGIARIDTTDVMDAALKVWAREMGLPEPPPRF